jgi:hypothetical protein
VLLSLLLRIYVVISISTTKYDDGPDGGPSVNTLNQRIHQATRRRDDPPPRNRVLTHHGLGVDHRWTNTATRRCTNQH